MKHALPCHDECIGLGVRSSSATLSHLVSALSQLLEEPCHPPPNLRLGSHANVPVAASRAQSQIASSALKSALSRAVQSLLARVLAFYGLPGAPFTAALYLALRMRPRPRRAAVLVPAITATLVVGALPVAFMAPTTGQRSAQPIQAPHSTRIEPSASATP